MARRLGFEPRELLHSPVFKTGALNHSANAASTAGLKRASFLYVRLASDLTINSPPKVHSLRRFRKN